MGGGGRPSGRRRAAVQRKATLRSTSYDDAVREPRHPDWDGGSWYGTSSGTYWTVNPREYADPRKHGPEYQARARRAASGGRAPGEEVHGEAADLGGAPGPAPTRVPRSSSARSPIGPAAAPDRVSAATSVGLAAGGLTLIPAGAVFLGSSMAGDAGLALMAVAAPMAVGAAVGLVAAILLRPR